MTEKEDSPAPESEEMEDKDVISDLRELSDFEFGTAGSREGFACCCFPCQIAFSQIAHLLFGPRSSEYGTQS